MKLRDAWGWPVVTVEGRHIGIKISNVIRILLWTNIRKTWQMRHEVEGIPRLTPVSAYRTTRRLPPSPALYDQATGKRRDGYLPKNGYTSCLTHPEDIQ